MTRKLGEIECLYWEPLNVAWLRAPVEQLARMTTMSTQAPIEVFEGEETGTVCGR
jgi:hypothetical protein